MQLVWGKVFGWFVKCELPPCYWIEIPATSVVVIVGTWSVALITVCKSERERQKRDTRGLDLDLRGLLPSAALSSLESLCSGRHGAKLMWWVGGGLGLFTPTYVHF